MHVDFGEKIKTYRCAFSRRLVYLPVILLGLWYFLLFIIGLTDDDFGLVDNLFLLLLFSIPIYVTIREIRFNFHRIIVYEDGLRFRKFLRNVDMGVKDIEHMIFEEVYNYGSHKLTFKLHIHLADGRVFKMNLHQFDSIWTRISRGRLDPPKLPALKDFYFKWRDIMYPGINFDTVIIW